MDVVGIYSACFRSGGGRPAAAETLQPSVNLIKGFLHFLGRHGEISYYLMVG